MKFTTEQLVKYGSVGAGTLSLVIGLLVSISSSHVFGIMFLILSITVGIVPYSIYSYITYSRFAKMEEQFPRFMKDFAESIKGGMGFPQALDMAARTDYGALSPEIRRTANQVSWGTPFPKAMQKFAERIQGSKVMKQSFALVNQAFLAGGDVAEIMDSIAENIGAIRAVENERKSAMSQQVMIMYFIYYMFLGIIVALYKLLVPMLALQGAASSDGLGFGVPLDSCEVVPLMCSVGTGFGFTGENIYFKTLFLFMSIIQGISSGVLAGVIGEGKVAAGIKHAAIMVVSALVVFIMFL